MSVQAATSYCPVIFQGHNLMAPSKWGMRQVQNLSAPFHSANVLKKGVELVNRVFFALIGIFVALLASPLYAIGTCCSTRNERFLDDVKHLHQEIEALKKVDFHSTHWEAACKRLSNQANSLWKKYVEFDLGSMLGFISHTRSLLNALSERLPYGPRTCLHDMEACLTEIKSDREIFLTLHTSLKNIAQPLLGKEKSIEECKQGIPPLIEKMQQLKSLTPDSPEWKNQAHALNKEIHICEENWSLNYKEQEPESIEWKILRNASQYLLNYISKEETLVPYLFCKDLTEEAKQLRQDRDLFLSLAKETVQLKEVFLAPKKPKATLRREFEAIIHRQLVEKLPVSKEQCKSFVDGANFPAQKGGGVNHDSVIPRLEEIMGTTFESDAVKLKKQSDPAPVGYTPVALSLSARVLTTVLHGYCLLKTPNGAMHAFSNVRGFEEGYLGPKHLSADLAKAFFNNGDTSAIANHPQYRCLGAPLIEEIVYVKDEYVEELTRSLETFHDLPWFDNKCDALRGMTLVLVMIKANQIAKAREKPKQGMFRFFS